MRSHYYSSESEQITSLANNTFILNSKTHNNENRIIKIYKK